MKKITIYTTPTCRYCINAKALLTQCEFPFEDIDVCDRPDLRETLNQQTGFTSVPKIFIDDHCIGGFDDLSKLHREGKLTALLESNDASKT